MGKVVLFIAALFLAAPASVTSQTVAAADGVTRATLANGLQVVIVPDRLAPVATTVMNYRVGSNEAPSGFPGMAHAQEHMMFRGSPGLSADELAAITAAMGGSFDADTQQSVTQYFFTVPSEDLDVALRIESIRMRGVLDSEELWRQERGAIEQEVAQDLSNPEYVLYTRLLQAMFKGTVYEHDALGTQASFDMTTGAMLKNFHDTWYVPNNAILVIAGNVDPRSTLEKVKSMFSDIPAKPLPTRPSFSFSPVTSETLRMDTDLPQGMAVVAFRMPGFDGADFIPTLILADVLASKRGGLYALAASGQALSSDFSLNILPQAGLGYAAAGFAEGQDGAVLAEKVRSVLSGIASGGIPADLVEAAKRREAAGAEFRKNSVQGLAMAWSDALAVEGRSSPDEDIEAIRDVSAEDVKRVAAKYLDVSAAFTAILTPKPSGGPVSPKGFGGTESFAPPTAKNVALPAWAEQALARLTIPTSTVHPIVRVLPNGITLIVQPENISNTVSVVGRVRNNPALQVSKGKEGVDRVLDGLFSFGTTSLDRLAFQKALDDIAADVSAGAEFSLSVPTDGFEKGLSLLSDNLLNPALPADAFPIVRGQVAASLAGELDSPDYLARRTLRAALLPSGDPDLRNATPETVSALRLEDVKGYYRSVFRPDMTTIAIVGNMTADQAVSAVTRSFGGWRSEGNRPNVDPPPVPPNKPSSTAVPDASRIQDQVILAETLGLTRTDPDYYALELGNNVLSGSFYATRLYRDLRESTGLVYFVGSSVDIGRTRSFFTVEYACDPKNVSKARAIVERDLADMGRSPVSAEELRQAKAGMLRRIPLSEADVDEVAVGLLARSVEGIPLDEPTKAAGIYLTLTAKRVQDAFAKWLRVPDLVQVTQGPAPK